MIRWFFFLCGYTLLSASAVSWQQPTSAEPEEVISFSSPLIDGCIDPVTGEFFDQAKDLEILGMPVELLRYYRSQRDGYEEQRWARLVSPVAHGFFQNWSWNHANCLYAKEEYAKVPQAGRTVTFLMRVGKEGTCTSLPQGDIPRDTSMLYQHQKWHLTTEKQQRVFGVSLLDADSLSGKIAYEKERSTNEGWRIQYHYNGRKPSLLEATLKGQAAGRVTYRARSNHDEWITSYGSWARYHFTPPLDAGGQKLLKCVESSHYPTITYDYRQDSPEGGKDKITPSPLLIRKSWPEGRYLTICYQEPKDRKKMWRGKKPRVVALRGPLTGKNQEVDKYLMEYSNGMTLVKDATGGHQRFLYDSQGRIFEHTRGTATGWHLYHKQRWSQEQESERAIRWVEDSSGDVLFRVESISKGATVTELLDGDWTGEGQKLQLDPRLGTLKKASEQIRRDYHYNGSGQLICQEEVGGGRCEYTYTPTKQLSSQRKLVGGVCHHRLFWIYNELGLPEWEIDDDGSGKDVEDLSGVYRRVVVHRIFHTCGPWIGLIAQEEQGYWDRASHKLTVMNTTEYHYDQHRQLVGKSLRVEPQGQSYQWRYEYNDRGQLIVEVDPAGGKRCMEYDLNGNCILMKGPDPACMHHYTYDLMDQLVALTVEDLHTHQQESTHYHYDTMGRLITEVSPLGLTTRIYYDAMGRKVRTEKEELALEQEGFKVVTAMESLTWDSYNRLVGHQKPTGVTRSLAYNSRGQLVYESTQGQETRYRYDLQGRCVYQQGALDGERSVYNPQGQLLVREELDGQGKTLVKHQLTYHGSLCTRSVDSCGVVSDFEYDGAGRLISKRLSQGGKTLQVESCRYDGLGRKIESWLGEGDDTGQRETFQYDWEGRLLEHMRWDQRGQMWCERIAYDQAGRIASKIRWIGENPSIHSRSEESYTYDIWGRVVEHLKEQQQNFQTIHTYESVGKGVRVHLETQKRSDGSRLLLWDGGEKPLKIASYDSQGACVQSMRYTYDRVGRCVGWDDESEVGAYRSARLRLDRYGRVVAREESDQGKSRTTRWEYNLQGLLAHYFPHQGPALHYDYDHAGRLQHLFSDDLTLDQHRSYDAYGRLLSIIQPESTNYLSYDGAGRVIFDEVLLQGGREISVKRSYDTSGRVTQLILPSSVSIERVYRKSTLGFSHGDLGYGTHISTPWGEYGYEVSFDLQGKEYLDIAGQRRWSQERNGLGQLIAVAHSQMEIYVAERDCMGRITSYQGKGFTSPMRRFSYDLLGGLKGEVTPTEATYYQYDGLQRRVKRGERHYRYSCHDKLLQVEPEPCWEENERGLTHLIYYQGRSLYLDYDVLGRLVKVEEPGQLIYSYAYDGLGRRLSRSVHTAGGALYAQQWFVYDDQHEIGALVGEPETFSWQALRILNLSPCEIAEAGLIFLEEQAYLPLHDLQGSTVGLCDFTSDRLLLSRGYNAFGVTTRTMSGELISPWGYGSKRTDPETGWVWYGRRVYLPEYGRWLTPDPLGEIDGPNLYTFLKNDPVNHYDAWGLKAQIGVAPAHIVDLSGNAQELVKLIGGSFASFHTRYGLHSYNTRAMAVIVSPELPWKGFFNGICSQEELCLQRLVDYAVHCRVNMLSIYSPSLGYLQDIGMVKNRALWGQDEFRPDYALAGRLYSLGLQLNLRVGFDRFDVLAHSNGEHVAFMGSRFIDSARDLSKVHLLALGGVGNLIHKHPGWLNVRCKVATQDHIARLARAWMRSDHVSYQEYGASTSSLQAHAIDYYPCYGRLAIDFLNTPYKLR